MSLVNYAAILCNCGKFQESAVVLEEIDIYKRNFDGFPFHRERIEMNNRIIINYLSGKAKAKECKAAYEELVKESEGIAEGIFYKSNYAIFMALDGEIEAAYKLLSKVLLSNDKEQRYNYRINVNLASFAYLCGKVEEALIRLEETLAWFNTSNTTDSIYQKKRLLLLLDYINKNVTAPAPTEWDAIHIGGRSSHYQATPHDYYERGFVYTIVYHWDI